MPLLAKAASVLAAPTAAGLPRPVLEALVRVVAGRIDLGKAPPDGKAIRDAVLRSGVLADPAVRPAIDAKVTLPILRSALSAFLGKEVEPIQPVAARPPPPVKGDGPRAPSPQPPVPPSVEPEETARQLLGHTDAALSRLKLLQLASSPSDSRPGAPAVSPDLRVEIPMQLGTEFGILQLLVERDGRRKPASPRERGWRMRFAMNFTATGEVGADIALLGQSANISIWAAEPATAETLEALLPELAPAISRHGLDIAGLRVRRGTPSRVPAAPGQLLDNAR